MEILKWLESCNLVENFNVLEFRQRHDSLFIKLEIFFINKSVLYSNEYLDDNDRSYSYHWQDKEGHLIIRWDNAPYHKEISTFPHHMHQFQQENIKESLIISLKEVLEFISNNFQQFK